jgi:hypothetical protein
VLGDLVGEDRGNRVRASLKVAILRINFAI